MFQYFSYLHKETSLLRNHKGLLPLYLIIYIILTAPLTNAQEVNDSIQSKIISVSGELIDSTLKLQINTTSKSSINDYELYQPSRIIIDIADATIDDQKKLELPTNLPVSLQINEISGSDNNLIRFEFTPQKKYTNYKVSSTNSNILLTVSLGETSTNGAQIGIKSPDDKISSIINEEQDIESQLPEVSLSGGNKTHAELHDAKPDVSEIKDNFSFGGYGRTRISVDFYKIDLHNVFRLIREVSNQNIVVDESVRGSLTLALNDVPWDFALDIILNLKDLQKEERYNTIVILPKKKEFSWPERAVDNFSFQTDENIKEQEAIVIKTQGQISPEIVKAQNIIKTATELENKGDFATAIQEYITAYEAWPENGQLANKISSLYLVYLGQNSKAAYYAKQALTTDNTNYKAALNAAIALANMQQYDEAQQYFTQSISTEKPAKEALLSYAVFSENQNNYDEALTLLEKFNTIYGENLDSMISAARILDKQGKYEAATEKYKTIMLSGYRIPQDLQKYIQNRSALNQSM